MKIIISAQINRIITSFKEGGIVCLPTDTVRSFSCSALNEKSIKEIFALKKRAAEKTLPIFIENLNMLRKYADLTSEEERLVHDVWPGNVTIIVKSKPNRLSASLLKNGKVAVRIPRNNLIKNICRDLGCPIVATSANLTGKNPVLDEHELTVALTARINLFVRSKQQELKNNRLSSTIIELINNKIKVLRQGDKVF